MLLLLAACERSPEPETMRSFTGPTMGTTYHVTVAGLSQDDGRARRVQRCVATVLDRVDEHLSTYSPTSEITALNRSAATDWMPVSEPLFAVLAAANRVSVETDGAFDVTVAPFVRLWGFGPGGAKDAAPELPPSPEFIHDAAAITGYTWLELRTSPDRAVRKNRTPLELDVWQLSRFSSPAERSDRIAHDRPAAR
ncbi:MAG: FAD:protein transferase ApbE [Steroidobacteraceae bacterium]|nr:FAD:protein transferase ApbE [Steroidobacteraceae bacterium]